MLHDDHPVREKKININTFLAIASLLKIGQHNTFTYGVDLV